MQFAQRLATANLAATRATITEIDLAAVARKAFIVVHVAATIRTGQRLPIRPAKRKATAGCSSSRPIERAETHRQADRLLQGLRDWPGGVARTQVAIADMRMHDSGLATSRVRLQSHNLETVRTRT